MAAQKQAALNAAQQNHPPMEWGNTYGLSIDFLQSLGIEPGPLKTKLFIVNVSLTLHIYHINNTLRKNLRRNG